VLSQKPFVLDMDTGERLANLADAQGLRLAVNQNGRWAPRFAYLGQAVTLYTPAGYSIPALEGTWFRDGFHGTMAELLCAIEERRAPSNSARGNLPSLALAFAAIASAHEGVAKIPGEVRRLPKHSVGV
jgi:predicted dehydrogenase